MLKKEESMKLSNQQAMILYEIVADSTKIAGLLGYGVEITLKEKEK